MNTEQQKIRLKIPTARSKLQSSFPEDPRGDIKIIIGKKVLKLQKAFLRLQSAYFKKKFTPEQSLLNIDEPAFNQDIFQNILKCFYGIVVQIKRSQVLNYYPIIKFLQIQCLLKYLRQDMTSNITSYDLFLIMGLAHQHNQQQIFQTCLTQLQNQNFQQLKYHRFELLKSSQQLFKLIIKTHNRSKNQSTIFKGLSYIEIDMLIKQFCEQKMYMQSQYHEMKFELIDKTALTSVEYKEIFLDQVKNNKKSFISNSFIKTQSHHNNNYIGLNSMIKPNNLTQSMISSNMISSNNNNNNNNNNLMSTSPLSLTSTKPSNQQQHVSNELTLQMQNTFQKKLNQQLKYQNQLLKNQLDNLRKISNQNQKNNQYLKQQLNNLESLIKLKQEQDKKQKQLIVKMEKIMIILKGQLDQKGQYMKKLQEKVGKLQKNINKKYVVDSDQQQQQQSHTIQSQIVPAHLIGQMISAPKKTSKQQQKSGSYGFKKKATNTLQQTLQQQQTHHHNNNLQQQKQQQQQLDDQDLQQLYLPRITFNQQPFFIPKAHLPTLADFITQQGWNKKKLTLLFRKSKYSSQSNYGNYKDIKNKNNQLLFLIKTEYNTFIGGYVTEELSEYVEGEYLEDKGAFIFTLSAKEKYAVAKKETSQAIFLSQTHFICFANDLMIPLQFLDEKSQCNWPSSYNLNTKNNQNNNNNMKSQKFIGGKTPFFILSMQVYQVQQAEMEMIL